MERLGHDGREHWLACVTVDRPGMVLFFFFWMFLGAFWFVEAASRGGFGTSALVLLIGATGLLLAYRPARREAAGVLVGAALPVLLQAYLLREGPGIVCSRVWLDDKENCRYLPSPLPWMVAGVLLITIGIVVQRRVRAAGATHPDRHQRGD
ncbi:hypothetical protein COUCH_32870 [Couchioplanes caeruleus]|uniref:hypothetical protein n=1 Tax=Couchioplanes caeruleus TaxID=56438 RepID=UPI0020BF0DCA|nr:hypothetical protein [Couchioplanes caeruleus]UQU63735.1 hypothetical protein COUCH_32870 [Couchioplanes caeruleus]